MTQVKTISGYETSCPECHGSIISDNFRGERVCNYCGLVINEKAIDYGYKRSMYNQKEKKHKARTGAPVTPLTINLNSKHRISLSEIGPGKNDLKRILSKDYQYHKGKEKTLARGKTILIQVKSKLGLPPHIFGGAFLLFKRLQKKIEDFSGRALETLILACIYYMSRNFNYPLFISELLKNAKTPSHRFKQTYNFIVNKLDLKTPPVNIRIYLDKYCYKLNIPYKLHRTVKGYFNKVPRGYTEGKNPRVIIATILYLVAKEHNLDITQREVADELEISCQAIRINKRKLRKYIKK